MKNIKAVITDGEVCIVHGSFVTRFKATDTEVFIEVYDQEMNDDVIAEATIVLPGPLLLENKP